jgi:ribonuclease HI
MIENQEGYINKLYFDGCCKGNPGKGGIGAVIYVEDKEVWFNSAYIGDNTTNNYAEYSALIMGLEKAKELQLDNLLVYGDSLLVINQINKLYKVKSKELLLLYNQVVLLTKYFTNIQFIHIYRKYNKRADELSNIPLK